MAASNSNSHAALPPSVEEAYRRKCIELRRRQQEVEEQNDAVRQRKVRLVRGVRKMRLERAILLEALARRMQKGGEAAGDGLLRLSEEESEDSSDSPPTPQERPLRSKKPLRRIQPGSPQPSIAPAPAPSIPDAAPSFKTEAADDAIPLSTTISATQISPATANDPAVAVPAPEPRPPPPAELYAQDYVDRALTGPNAGAFSDPDATLQLGLQDWTIQGREKREEYHRRYEERMDAWTRSEDVRKRAIAKARKAAKTGGRGESQEEGGSEGGSQQGVGTG